jgi:AraC-like DNA-binding protein
MHALVDFLSRPLLTAQQLTIASSQDQMAGALAQLFDVKCIAFDAPDAPFSGVSSTVKSPFVTLHYCKYSSGARALFPESNRFRQLVCLSGAGAAKVGRATNLLGPETTCLVPPGQTLHAHYGDAYVHLVVSIDQAVVRKRIEAIHGVDLTPFDLTERTEGISPDGYSRFKMIAVSFAMQFSAIRAGYDAGASGLEQALLSAFIAENRLAPASLADRPARPSDRSAALTLEDFIQANWDKPLTVEAVAEACGVSVRSVFARFRADFGVSPMTYLRDLRLDKANALLRDSDSELSVLDVAMRCGFASFGHFARRYRERFGELPSATLSRRR